MLSDILFETYSRSIEMSSYHFKDVILEGIEIKPTEYGTNTPDLNNREISKIDRPPSFTDKFVNGGSVSVATTFFKHNNIFVRIQIEKKTLGYELIFSTGSSVDETSLRAEQKTTSPSALFGNVIFVANQICRKLKIKSFYFRPIDNTNSLYKKLATNKRFQKYLQDNNILLTASSNFKVYKVKILNA